MKLLISGLVIAVLCLTLQGINQAQGETSEERITVLSPVGIPPEIQLKPMAPRLNALSGKTIYLVNDGYLGTDILLGEMQDWFEANMPEVHTLYKEKGGGGFTAEDPALWAEIEEKADAVIMGMGH